jgi:hypothetical protein
MNKYILLMTSMSVFIFADISAQEAAELEIRAAKIRKELGIHIPTAKEKEVARIRHELKLDFDTSSKEALLENNKPTTVQSLDVSKEDSIVDSVTSVLTSVKNQLSSKHPKEESYSFSKVLNNFYNTVGLESGEKWGMPSIFGLNKKREKSWYEMGFIGSLHDTGTTIFKGMKYSGQSAEFTSGMIYKSSKLYNTMFGMFEDSPFNVFEDEEETSVLDVFEGGNKILDVFN